MKLKKILFSSSVITASASISLVAISCSSNEKQADNNTKVEIKIKNLFEKYKDLPGFEAITKNFTTQLEEYKKISRQFTDQEVEQLFKEIDDAEKLLDKLLNGNSTK